MLIAVASHKGGIGKTTTAVNLAAALAEKKRRVLVVDVDPQGNSSSSLGVVLPSTERAVGEVLLHREDIKEVIRPVRDGIDLLPSTKGLLETAERINAGYHKEEHLRRELAGIAGDYHDVVIDCPPALGVLTANAVFAADLLLAPFTLDAFAYSGLSDLLAYVEDVRRKPLPVWILISQYNARTTVMNGAISGAIEEYGRFTLRTRIPLADAVRKAHAAQMPVLAFSSHDAASEAFRELAIEILTKEDKKHAAA